jgi:hypothetical protein
VIKKLVSRIKSLSKMQILAMVLIVIGLFLVVNYGVRATRSFREIQYARQNNFEAGNPDTAAIRPWMNMQYVAVVYTVPQEYLFSELGIPFEQWNSRKPLFYLNEKFGLGPSEDADPRNPAIINQVRQAIEKYRENPVATGLKGDIRGWMSIQYIANSTGVPAEYIFAQLGIPMEGNAYIPLEVLTDRVHVPGGPKAVVDGIKAALADYKANQ